MEKDQELQRFQQALAQAIIEDDESERIAAGAPRLSRDVEARLLNISLGRRVQEHASLLARLRTWLKKKSSIRILIPATLLPAAVVLFLFFGRPLMEPPVDRFVFRAEAEEARTVLGGPSQVVASTTELHIKLGQYLALSLTPPRPQTGTVTVRSFVQRGDKIEPWDVRFEALEDGSFRLYVPVDVTLGLGPEQDILLAFGRPGALPNTEDLRSGKAADERRWHLQRLRLYVEQPKN